MPDLPGNRETGRVREVAWLELFPWLRLIGTLRLALKARMLALAAVGLICTQFGWWGLSQMFSGSRDVEPLISAYTSCPWRGDNSGIDGLFFPHDQAAGPHLAHFPSLPFRDVWWKLSAPVRQMFDQQVTFVSFTYLLLCALWAIAVWSLFGGALTRMAALAIGREEQLGARAALRFATRRWSAYFGAPVMPLIGLLLVGLPAIVAGLLMRFDLGALAVGIIWPVLLVIGLLSAMFLLGLIFGWPLMFVAISAEGTDSFDGVARAYSYVNQRPFQYLCYAILATLLSLLGGMFVEQFSGAVIYLTHWLTSWGAGNDRMQALTTVNGGPWGAKAIWFWNGTVRVAALGFVFSHFWVASTAIYLLLRRDADGAEFDDLYQDERDEPRGLPTLESDARGVPVVPQEASETPATPAAE